MTDFRASFAAAGPLLAAPQDTRNYIFGCNTATPTTVDFEWNLPALPSKVDLKPNVEEIEDQLNFSSCVGQSSSSALEVLLDQAGQYKKTSAHFIYYIARARQGGTITDDGTSISTAFAEMTKLGACEDSYWPMSKPINTKPGTDAYANGLLNLVDRYETCRDVNDVKVALASGYPVVFGTPLLDPFFDIKGKLSTHLAQYNPGEIKYTESNYVGNHAMCIVGYDDAGGYFIVENSWGPSYADGGFVAISYESFELNAFQVYVPRVFRGLSHQIPDRFYIRNGVVPDYVPPPAPAPQPEPEPTPAPTPAPSPAPVEPPLPLPIIEEENPLKKWIPIIVMGLIAAAFFLL